MTYYKKLLGCLLISYLLLTSSCNFYYKRLGYPRLENVKESQLYDADFVAHNGANLARTRLLMKQLYYRPVAIGTASFDTSSSRALRPLSKVKPFYYTPTSVAKTRYEYVCFTNDGTFTLSYLSTPPNRTPKDKVKDYHGYYQFVGDSLVYELIAPITGQRTDFGRIIVYNDSITLKNYFTDANEAIKPSTYILYK